jgi:hypothetical protein
MQQLSGGASIGNRINGGVDELFSFADSTGSYTPISNGLSSVLALVDSSGNLGTQYTYGPFGSTSVTGAPSGAQYTGQESDGSGLYFYRARYRKLEDSSARTRLGSVVVM